MDEFTVNFHTFDVSQDLDPVVSHTMPIEGDCKDQAGVVSREVVKHRIDQLRRWFPQYAAKLAEDFDRCPEDEMWRFANRVQHVVESVD